MEEDLRAQEALVANVHVELGVVVGVEALVVAYPLGGVTVVLVELLRDVRADVAVALCGRVIIYLQLEF